MGSVLTVAAAWLLVATALALLIGVSVRLADKRSRGLDAVDHGTKDHDAEARNVVVDAPLLRIAPEPPDEARPRGPGRSSTSDRPATPVTRKEADTIPGLPAARPPVGRPPVPGSTRQRPRKSGHG